MHKRKRDRNDILVLHWYHGKEKETRPERERAAVLTRGNPTAQVELGILRRSTQLKTEMGCRKQRDQTHKKDQEYNETTHEEPALNSRGGMAKGRGIGRCSGRRPRR